MHADEVLVPFARQRGRRILVTGCAGFIGSSLSDALLASGAEVIGVDRFSDSYAPIVKRANAAALSAWPDFDLVELDLATADVDGLLDGVDAVVHVAGRAGVRDSWGTPFAEYVSDNITATQTLLEACRRASVRRVVVASSSSVYGTQRLRRRRAAHEALRPESPYGVTKLAAEQLACAYARSTHLPVTCLRFFTVYGPRQRPDMLVHRLLASVDLGRPFELFGDGTQVRDLTYVGDVVEAIVTALDADVEPGTVVDIGAGAPATVARVIQLVEDVTGGSVRLLRRSTALGDVERTVADVDTAASILGWRATTDLAVGIAAQAAWQLGPRDLRATAERHPSHIAAVRSA
jgi:nucleoside-diphosphate-sugar epimerase